MSERKAPTNPQSDATAAPRKRILVVDDNRDSAESLAMVLRLLGYDVRTAHDGRQALVDVAVYRPNLVLLDIGLPRMNGYEVARQLRLEPGGGQTKLVALSGYAREDDRREAYAVGFDHYLVKPVDFDALYELLAALESTTD
jgi:CheY-like chemotaxis protein